MKLKETIKFKFIWNYPQNPLRYLKRALDSVQSTNSFIIISYKHNLNKYSIR